MVRVSRLNGTEYFLNSDLIESIEATPDTVVTLMTGKKLVVRESVNGIISLIVQFKRQCLPSVIVREDLDAARSNPMMAVDEEPDDA